MAKPDKDLPPLFEKFHASEKLRTCRNCGAMHPGKATPTVAKSA